MCPSCRGTGNGKNENQSLVKKFSSDKQCIPQTQPRVSLGYTSPLLATNREEYDVVLGNRYFDFLHASPLLLKPWCIMIEQGDVTRSLVVPNEPSQTVKEYK